MYFDGEIHHIEEDDQCFSCEYFVKGVSCPLLEALALGVVSLEEDIVVKNCGFYKEFKRRLTLVDVSEDEEAPSKKKKGENEEECSSGN